MIGIVNHWHESGKSISVNELAEIVFKLATKGALGCITEE